MKDKRNRHGAVGKSSSEQHFRKCAAITLLHEISGALYLAQPGLTAGWLADKIEIFKIHYKGAALLQLYQCV